MRDKLKGCIVEESLEDNRILNDIEIVKMRITSDEKQEDRWHIYNCILSDEQVKKIHSLLKQGWFMHFWKDDQIVVLFKEKKFILNAKDKGTWSKAIDYGLSLNIPRGQLEFLAEF